jgi:hypothetical protein
MYDYRGPERDLYAETYLRISGGKAAIIWIAWVVVTYFGFVLGENWANEVASVLMPSDPKAVQLLSLEETVQTGTAASYFAAFVGALVAGGVLALAQTLFMLPFLKFAGAKEWFIATFIGRAVRWMAVYAISREFVRLTFDKPLGTCLLGAFLIGIGVIAGLALGYPQMQILDRRTHHAERIMLANIVGPIVSALLITACLYFELENTIRGWATPLTAIITAAVTGIAVIDLLKHPTTQAEWSEMFRQTTAKLIQADTNTVLGSTLYERVPPSSPPPA